MPRALYVPNGQTFIAWYDKQPAPKAHLNTARRRFVEGYPFDSLLRKSTNGSEELRILDVEPKAYTLPDGSVITGRLAVVESVPALAPSAVEAEHRRKMQPRWATRRTREQVYERACETGYAAEAAFLLDDNDPRCYNMTDLLIAADLVRAEGIKL